MTTNEDVKEWLNRGFKINKEIEQLLEAKERAKALACKMVASTDADKVQGGYGNGTEDKFINYVELTKVISKRINDMLDIQRDIVKAISKVENTTYRAILTARYVNYKKWEDISKELYYDFDARKIFVLHNRALNELHKFIKWTQKDTK